MAALLTHRVKLREAHFEDYQAIAALESSHGLSSKPLNEWRRLWAGNPCYEQLGARWPIGWVLQHGERIVGCSCNIPLPYVFRGRSLIVASGRGWVVDDQYRGYAPLLGDEYFNQPSVDLFLNNTVNDKSAEVIGTFGSIRVPAGDWSKAAFAITEHRGFAESVLRIKHIPRPRWLSYPVGLALSLKDRLTGRCIPTADVEVTLQHDFDPRFAGFWESLRSSNTLLAVRSREVLRWHFGVLLNTGSLWVLTAGRAGQIDAYAVFQRRDEPLHGLKRMRLVDFQARGEHDQYCAALMRRAAGECRVQGIHLLEHVGCDLEQTRVFDQSAPYRRQLPAWSFFYLTRDEELSRHLAEPQAWAPSSYDGDASL